MYSVFGASCLDAAPALLSRAGMCQLWFHTVSALLLLYCLSVWLVGWFFFFLRTFLYILYDTSLYRLFEDSSCQFGSFPNEIHPKVFLLLFSCWVE